MYSYWIDYEFVDRTDPGRVDDFCGRMLYGLAEGESIGSAIKKLEDNLKIDGAQFWVLVHDSGRTDLAPMPID